MLEVGKSIQVIAMKAPGPGTVTLGAAKDPGNGSFVLTGGRGKMCPHGDHAC